jgi:hypothetical protein
VNFIPSVPGGRLRIKADEWNRVRQGINHRPNIPPVTTSSKFFGTPQADVEKGGSGELDVIFGPSWGEGGTGEIITFDYSFAYCPSGEVCLAETINGRVYISPIECHTPSG